MEKNKNRQWYSYTGPESSIIKALDKDNQVFRKKDGYFVSRSEELLIRSTPQTDNFFTAVSIQSNSGTKTTENNGR